MGLLSAPSPLQGETFDLISALTMQLITKSSKESSVGGTLLGTLVGHLVTISKLCSDITHMYLSSLRF